MSKDGSRYTRASGKLSKPSYGIYSDSRPKEKDSSTVYTVDDNTENDESNEQYPLGMITDSQGILINSFLSGLCGKDSVEINEYRRAIHFIGEWRCKENEMTVVCTAAQPSITNAIVHIKGISTRVIEQARADYIAVVGGKRPHLNVITNCPQPQGSLAIPFTDYMLQRKVISLDNVNWSNVIFSQTQCIFIVVIKDSAYECVLTHISCGIMSKCPPHDAVISPPNSKSESYSFRRLSVTYGNGSGPSITVHKSGTMQFQGRGEYIKSIASNFRNCINNILVSDHAQKFIHSLGIVRDVSKFMPEM